MEEDSNGKAEETQKEETHSHRNGVGVVKHLFEEFKSEVRHVEETVLHGKDSSSSSSESDEEEEKIESVEEEVPESVSDPVEVVSSEMTQEVEIEIPVEDDDSGYTNVVQQETEETKETEKVIELESEDVVEEEINLPSSEEAKGVTEWIEEAEAPASYENVGETSEVVDEEASKEEEEKNSEPPADVPVVDNGNKAEIITDTTITPPIISISNRTVQPTSWRSCCGLFDVLRRNK